MSCLILNLIRRAELFDHHKFDEWVERGEAAAIPSSLRLYNEVRELGFKTFLLTGRSEGHRGVTVENLNKQGFHDWEKLILRYTSHISFSRFLPFQARASILCASFCVCYIACWFFRIINLNV